jgi:hypothetical protein
MSVAMNFHIPHGVSHVSSRHGRLMLLGALE